MATAGGHAVALALLLSACGAPGSPTPQGAIVSGLDAAAPADGPADAAPALPCEVTGRLSRASTGASLPGVVRVRASSGRWRESSVGTDGLFRIPGLPGGEPVEFEARVDGLPPVGPETILLPDAAAADLGEIEAGMPIDLEVRVLNHLGQPVAGTPVAIHRAARIVGGHDASSRVRVRPRGVPVAEVPTDPIGRTRAVAVPPGRIVIEVRREGFARALHSFVVHEGEAPRIEVVVLELESVLEGRLRADLRTPIVGARVSATWLGHPLWAPGFEEDEVESGTDGSFRIGGLRAGRHELRVRIGDDRVHRYGPVLVGRGGPLDLLLPDEADLGVRVVAEEDGAPIPRVPVFVHVDRGEAPFWNSHFRAVTDAEGLAMLRGVHSGEIDVVRPVVPGRVPEALRTAGGAPWKIVPGVDRDVEVRVARGVVLEGTIRDPAGAPVPGARLRIVARDRDSRSPRSVPPHRADGSGRFRIEGVPAGSVVAQVEPALTGDTLLEESAFQYSEADPSPDRSRFEIDGPDPRVHDFVVRDRGMVLGSVRNMWGGRPEGVVVNVYSENGDGVETLGRAAVTGDEGAFTIAGVDAEPGARIFVWGRDSAGREGRSVWFEMPADRRLENVHFGLSDGKRFEGRVVAADGQPIPGARVGLLYGSVGPSDGWPWDPFATAPIPVPVGPDGSFRRLDLPARAWTPVVSAPGFEPAVAPPVDLRFDAPSGGAILTIRPLAIVEGEVADSGGGSVAGARVWREVVRDGVGRPLDPDGAAPVLTDSRGRFRLEGGPEGNVAVTVEAVGFRRRTVQARTGQRDLRIAIEAARVLEGRVLEAGTGRPIRGIEIECDSRHEIMRTFPALLTDREGRFRIDRVEPGTDAFTVGVGSAGRRDFVPAVVRIPAAGAGELEIRLHRGLSISGALVDRASRPVPGVTVRVERERALEPLSLDDLRLRRTHWVSTDAEGRFEVVGLEEGRYILDVDDRWRGAEGPPRFPIRVRGVEAGTRDLVLVERTGVWLRARTEDDLGQAVLVARGGLRPGEPNLRLWVRGADEPPPGDPGRIDEDPAIVRFLGPAWKRWVPVAQRADGEHRFGPAVEGALYDVCAIDDRRGLWVRTRVRADGGEPVTLRLRPGSSIEGVVIDDGGRAVPAGVPVASTSLAGLPPDAARAATATDAEGRFRITGLTDGAHELVAGGGDSGCRVSESTGPVHPGSDTVTLRVHAGLDIAGRVVDRSGLPGRATAVIASTSSGGAGASVAEDGTFRVRGLAEGDVWFQVTVTGKDARGIPFLRGFQVRERARAPGENVVIDITDQRPDR